MSNTEFHFAKLVPIKFHEPTLEDFCKKISNNCELASFNENYIEHVKDSMSENYFIHGDNIYAITEHEESDDSDFQKLITNNDGSFTFIGSFYNGGTCFEEVLEEEFDKL